MPLETVRANFAKYGLLDDQVRFLPGWFRETLPTAPIDRLALMRLDGDMYESVIVPLESLYPKVSSGGYVIVDEYDLPTCAKAVDDYRSRHTITTQMLPIRPGSAWEGVYWQKP